MFRNQETVCWRKGIKVQRRGKRVFLAWFLSNGLPDVDETEITDMLGSDKLSCLPLENTEEQDRASTSGTQGTVFPTVLC
jgi:hypothetical protein